jgi:hypothetical protein
MFKVFQETVLVMSLSYFLYFNSFILVALKIPSYYLYFQEIKWCHGKGYCASGIIINGIDGNIIYLRKACNTTHNHAYVRLCANYPISNISAS